MTEISLTPYADWIKKHKTHKLQIFRSVGQVHETRITRCLDCKQRFTSFHKLENQMEIYKSSNSRVSVLNPGHQYAVHIVVDEKRGGSFMLQFQDGAANEVGGRNGIQNEEVLAVLIDRLKYLQDKFPCRENAIVITKLEEALMWLERRTEMRKLQGVEGKNEAHKS